MLGSLRFISSFFMATAGAKRGDVELPDVAADKVDQGPRRKFERSAPVYLREEIIARRPLVEVSNLGMDQRRIEPLSRQRVQVRQEPRILIVRYRIEAGFSNVTFIELGTDVFVADRAFQPGLLRDPHLPARGADPALNRPFQSVPEREFHNVGPHRPGTLCHVFTPSCKSTSSADQMRTVSSNPYEAMCRPSGKNATASTEAVWSVSL